MKLKTSVKIVLVLILLAIVFMVIVVKSRKPELISEANLCSKYSIYGNIIYDEEKENYVIKSITYCANYDISKYKEIKATLFEKGDNSINEMASFDYNESTFILLDKFLTNKTFNADYSKAICMNYKKEKLYLEAKVTSFDGSIDLINIPLFMDQKCK